MIKPKIGLLPLYLELYDNAMPEVRPRVDEFRNTIITQLQSRELDVIAAPVCRLQAEFEDAVRSFEGAEVDAMVTLHLAYSPSLESSEALARTEIPIIVLDTTPTFSYSPQQDPIELMYNHGIHGVQDMCNLLIRNGKKFQIEAGHWEKSDVLDRVASWARAAHAAKSMKTARVGRIGEPFKGMGDFAVEPEVLRGAIGVETIACDLSKLRSLLPDANDPAIDAELAADKEKFALENVSEEAHRNTIRASLTLRRWIEQEQLTGLTMNFLAFTQATLPVVPFLEASKAMARGLGYAGEGDVLTAALVGALASVYPEVTFTEMFCPDWEGNSIFLSHMGEMNIALAAEKPVLMEKPFPWTDANDPVVAIGRFKGGEAVLVDLAPGQDDEYTLIVALVKVLDVAGEDRMNDSIRGWIQPQMPIADFLAAYSRVGGTHHKALVYGDNADEIAKFGEMMGWRVVVLGDRN